MRSLATRVLGSMTSEGRPQAFYWQYGWVDVGFLAKNNLSLVAKVNGSPTRRLRTTSVEGEAKNVEEEKDDEERA